MWLRTEPLLKKKKGIICVEVNPACSLHISIILSFQSNQT